MDIQPFIQLLEQQNPEPINIKLEGDIDLPELRNLLSSIVRFNLNPARSNMTSTFSMKAKQLSIIESLRHGDRDKWEKLAIVVGVIGGSILIGYGFKTWYNHEYGKAVQKIATGNWVMKNRSGVILRAATVDDFMFPFQILSINLANMGVCCNISALLNLHEGTKTTVAAELNIKPLSRTPLEHPNNKRNAADTGWEDPNGAGDILDSELNTPKCIHLNGYAMKSTSVLKTLLNATDPRQHYSPLFNERLSVEDQRHLKTQIREIFGSASADIPQWIQDHRGEARVQGFLGLLDPNVHPLLRPEFDQELANLRGTPWASQWIVNQIRRF